MEYVPAKLMEWQINGGYEIVLKNLPIADGIKQIIERGIDDVVLDDPKDSRLHGQAVRCFLDKTVAPPLIHVHIDHHYAASYLYNDREFAKRSTLRHDHQF